MWTAEVVADARVRWVKVAPRRSAFMAADGLSGKPKLENSGWLMVISGLGCGGSGAVAW